MYTRYRYLNITGTDGVVPFLVQAMLHIISADRVNFCCVFRVNTI